MNVFLYMLCQKSSFQLDLLASRFVELGIVLYNRSPVLAVDAGLRLSKDLFTTTLPWHTAITHAHTKHVCSNAVDTRSRNLLKKLVQETCMKNLTQVHHSFLHNNNNNWSANHIARFVSHDGQCLSWNRAVFYCVQETCTIKTCTRLTDTRASFLYQTTWQASGTSFLSVCHWQ